MNQVWIPPELKLVSTVPFPEHLFVCLAKIQPEAGGVLKGIFETGKNPPKKLQSVLMEHLVYNYDLGEKGLYWEAGPSADFTEILYIFTAPGLEEARRLMHGDPFYRDGIFYDDWWFEWHVHVPIWKIKPADQGMMEGLMRAVNILPTYPPGVKPDIIEFKVEPVTPLRLFVSISKARAEAIKKLERDQQAGKPVPSFFINHAYYRLGPGGTVPMGFDWEAGPSMDQSYDLTVMSVGSMEMARLLRENDPVSQNGLFYDHRYFEWCILMPWKKASPTYKDNLKKLLKTAGITPAVD
ncbi:MAG: hypothetical protein A2Z29_06315 [Chloroflexi bacterium RBG_16_56_11]|nr:MAG: hypothetical protein A2Z29_06315 [Chloroflexi bacterium RBG_16_56_11]